MAKKEKQCLIPSRTRGRCDLEWGHAGDVHYNQGDGFWARDHDAEHHKRQRERRPAEFKPVSSAEELDFFED